MVELVAVIIGSGALAAVVSWLATRRRDRAEVTAIDVATTSQLASEFIAANRKLVAAEHRSDIAQRDVDALASRTATVVDRLAERLGEDDPDVVALRRIADRATRTDQMP